MRKDDTYDKRTTLVDAVFLAITGEGMTMEEIIKEVDWFFFPLPAPSRKSIRDTVSKLARQGRIEKWTTEVYTLPSGGEK